MDRADARTPENDRLERIVAALRGGVVLVDSEGQLAWLDDKTRRRVNGDLDSVALAAGAHGSEPALECTMVPVKVTIDGERTMLCAIQANPETKDTERDLIAAIQAVMADASWFTRTVIDKLKTLRQSGRAGEASDGVLLLSDREREVLGLLCEGLSDDGISQRLRLSPNTVRNHIASLYRKIGVNRRSAAIIWARERGINGLDVVALRRRRATAGQDGGRADV